MDAAVDIGARRYAVTYDGSARRRTFATGTLRDDADDMGIARGAGITLDDPLLRVALLDDRYAIFADPDVALTDTSLAHPIALTVRRAGYRPAAVTITIPAFPTGPVVRDIALRREPGRLRGRIFGLTGGLNPVFAPLADARVEVTGPAGPGGELPLMLARPLTRDPGPTATVRRRGMTALADVAAAAFAPRGQDHIVLIDGAGVVAGQLLRFGSTARGHWVEVAQVAADPDRPAPATIAWLTEPLAGSVVADRPIRRFSKGALSGATASLVGATFAGEALLWVDALPAAGEVVTLREAGFADQYYERGALSDAAGDYAIDGLARIGTVTLETTAAGLITQSRTLPVGRLAGAPLDWWLTS